MLATTFSLVLSLTAAPEGVGDAASVAQAAPSPLAPPSPRDARELGVGSYAADSPSRGIDGIARGWRDGRGERLTVVALTSVTCPLCRKFGPSLARIEDAFRERGVKFVFVNVSGTDSAADMRKQVADLGLEGLYLNDAGGEVARSLRARTTTEVFVIDSANTLVYRGAVHDQYGVNFTLPEPRRRLLEDALDAALAGRAPEIQATSAPGCAIEPAKTTTADGGEPSVTYARDISRIMAANCIECHREGGVGPFRLDTYEAVSRRATMIRAVTEEGTMPPWFAAPIDSGAHASPWSNDRSISQAEKDAIAAWIAAGKPEGDPKDLPLPRAFAESAWKIGPPDAVFELPQPIAVKADGFMPYQNVLVPTNLTEDRWVKAVQIAPTDPSVVHHVLVFALDEDAAKDPATRRRLGADEASGYWAAYVPGNDSMVLPEGMARKLPANSSLLFQIHYTPNGKATSDQMKIGLVFSDAPPKHLVRTAAVANIRLRIPPGAANHRETGQLRVPADAKILAFMPHMHVRGKAYRYELELPGQPKRTVLDIPKYDFNWQLRYELREPLEAPRGAVLHGTAWYDNSADNPANPDPTKTVRWGQQTVDEMMLGYIEYYIEGEDPMNPMDLPGRGALRGRAGGGAHGERALSFEALRRQFDRNNDGRIEKSEVAPALHRRFDELDANGDGVLTKDDFGN
jgi:mono/diheme cytochrome c family protein/thiol-disulfide isomerase/thioredoxin